MIKYLYEPKHKPYTYFWAAFTYSFAVHRYRVKRHSLNVLVKLCYIVNICNLLIKKNKNKKQTEISDKSE